MGTNAKIRFEDDDGVECLWRQYDGYPSIVLNEVQDIITRVHKRIDRTPNIAISPDAAHIGGLLVAVGARSPHCPYRDYDDWIEAAFDSRYKMICSEEYGRRWAEFGYDFRRDEDGWRVRIAAGEISGGMRWGDEVPVDEAVDRWGDIGVEERENAAELLGIE